MAIIKVNVPVTGDEPMSGHLHDIYYYNQMLLYYIL